MDKVIHEVLWKFDEKLDALTERVAKTEGELVNRAKKSWRQKISETGGLVALIISLIIGGFTLHDKVIVAPQERAERNEAAIRQAIADMNTISAQISSLNWQIDPIGAATQAQAFTPTRLALIESVIRAREITPNVLKYADHQMLANELEQFSRFDEAIAELSLAMELATDSYERGNSYWTLGRIKAKQEDLVGMNSNYELAIAEFRSLGMRTTAYSVLAIYLEWIAWLIAYDECEGAHQILKRFQNDLDGPDVWPQTKQVVEIQFNQMLLAQPRTCDLEPYEIDDALFEGLAPGG